MILGDTNPLHPGDITIPKYLIPENVDRNSVHYQEGLRLYAHTHDGQIIEEDKIIVPFTSKAAIVEREFLEPYADLTASVQGDMIILNRCPRNRELDRVDVGVFMEGVPTPHICDKTCTDINGNLAYVNSSGDYLETPLTCAKIEKDLFGNHDELNEYLILRTAYLISKFNPLHGGIRAELADDAKTILSKLRQNDLKHTRPDYAGYKNNFKTIQI